MRKFQKLMLSHRCVCVYVCWSTCISTTVKMNSEPKKNITGFFKKNSHPQETTEIPCLPPQPPTSMLWSEVPNIINRNGCFFWRPPNTKFRRQHWIGGRGEHDLCGVVLHGMAVFFEEPGMSASARDEVGNVASRMSAICKCHWTLSAHPTPPHPTPPHHASARDEVGSVASPMCASASNEVGSVASRMSASARDEVGSVASRMSASARDEVGNVASPMCASAIERYQPTPPHPTPPHHAKNAKTHVRKTSRQHKHMPRHIHRHIKCCVYVYIYIYIYIHT